MRVLFLGDIFGRSGREAISRDLLPLKKKEKIDFVVANGENAAHGFGITERIAKQLLDAGIDVLTIGDHAIHRKENPSDHPRCVVAGNYQEGKFGSGYKVFEKEGQKIAVISLLGRVFVETDKKKITNPFEMFDQIYAEIKDQVDMIFVDFHAEATGEKQAFGFHVDGRATVVVGTHTHVQTSDLKILPKGTGYLTDLGMCGNHMSVIGADIERALTHHLPGVQRTHLQPQDGDGQLSGAIFEIKNSVVKKTKLVSPKF
ncbi:MAG: YmdB family metallophosphoesterase [Alphaproteobacteria bacterium]|nr:YmdB family metallophosphoesterase [Alphaproteobacteria bacterium]